MLPPDVLERVVARAQESASHSWEYAIVFEALLEYRNPESSVFAADPFPNGEAPRLRIEDVEALRYIRPHIRTDSATLSDGNGSSADPVSLCPAALLLAHSPSLPPSTRKTYQSAVSRQFSTLFTHTPRLASGALSHRASPAALWSDFVCMVPPALAYHAASAHDARLARLAATQCLLYRSALCTPTGLWQHIAPAPDARGAKRDDGAWCTGNAWVAAGLARVLAALAHVSDTLAQQDALRGVLRGVLDAVAGVDARADGLLPNYLDDGGAAFAEVAGTALMGAAALRFARLLLQHGDDDGRAAKRYAEWGDAKMRAVARHVDPRTGIARPVVNSLEESEEMPLGGVNPEAQAFVVLLYAAWRDWRLAVGSDC